MERKRTIEFGEKLRVKHRERELPFGEAPINMRNSEAGHDYSYN